MVGNEAETSIPDVSMPLPSSAMMSVTQAPLGYEIVTMPTFENASFPFDLNPESPYPNILDQASTSTAAYPLSPYSSLPLPQSMAFSEPTFGRRLQRHAGELAYRLITMPDPPKHRYAEVFGFCMLFEPIDKIRERLSTALKRTASESLNWWQAPFWAAGGSGQHQLQQDNSGSGGARVGNQGTVDHMKYAFPGGQFGLGPFGEKINETRDKRIDPRMRIRLPGFEGDFYDPDEVELYLQIRGVAIQPGQDYLTTEVDVTAFKNGMTMEQGSQGQGQGQAMTGFGDWPQSLDEAFHPPAPAEPSPGGSTAMASASTSTTLSDVRTDPSGWPIDDFTDMFNHAASGQDISGLGSNSGAAPESRKRLITLDVNVFVRGTSFVTATYLLPRSLDYSPVARLMADAFYVFQNSPNVAPVSDDHLASGPKTSTQHSGKRPRLMQHLGFRIICKVVRFRYCARKKNPHRPGWAWDRPARWSASE